jgi:hypothetical protein
MGAIMHRILLVAGLCLVAAPALAQDSRVTIAVGAAAQPTTASFTDVTTFPFFAETARTEGHYRVGDGLAVDIGATVRVWRGLGIGLAVTRATREADSEVNGSFPHPFYFATNRTGTWSSSALDRSEVGVHLSAAWQIVRDSRFNLSLFGGPSLFNYDQAVVDDVEVIQSYPYDTIDARLVTGSVDGSAVGFHAGVDLGWFFTRHFGVGGVLRFTSATKKGVRIGDGEPFDLDMGGAQGGGGIRLRF